MLSNNTSDLESACVIFFKSVETKHETVDSYIRFVLEGVTIPVVGLVGIVGKVHTYSNHNILSS